MLKRRKRRWDMKWEFSISGNFLKEKKFKPLIQKHAKLKEEFWSVFYLYLFLCWGREIISLLDPP
jgi:hypothetical protein